MKKNKKVICWENKLEKAKQLLKDGYTGYRINKEYNISFPTIDKAKKINAGIIPMNKPKPKSEVRIIKEIIEEPKETALETMQEIVDMTETEIENINEKSENIKTQNKLNMLKFNNRLYEKGIEMLDSQEITPNVVFATISSMFDSLAKVKMSKYKTK
jgi:hypothetical protein